MTDKDQDKKADLAAKPAPDKKGERDTSSSVDAILTERLRLEQEQAALDQMLKDKFQKNVTVMFTDIKGSTAYFETYGDVEGRAMVQRHNAIMIPKVEQNGGKVIKTIGDAIMATFDESAKGVRAAIAMQKALAEYNAKVDQKHKKILVRIGLNFGPAVVEEKDVFGDAVNVAARVESQADAEQIMVSEDLYKQVRGEDDILVRFVGEVTVKGKAEPVKLYRVLWSDEQLVSEGEFKKAATRRTVDKRGKVSRGRVIELVTSRDANNLKVSVFERKRGEEKTVSQYDVVKIDDKLIKTQCDEVVNLLNRANKRGKVTKEILKQLQAAGQILFDHLMSPEAKQKVLNSQAEHLIIRMDDRLVHVPWELLFDGKQFLCQRFSMGRIVATRQHVAEVQTRHIAKPLRMLVVADPRSDLDAARREGVHVRDELDKEHEFINVNLKTSDVSVNFLKSKIRDFDVIHYAGHADYDSKDPGNSGWLMADGKLSANDVTSMTGKKPMPALVFANGCQSGQTEEWKIGGDYEKDIFGLANAFLVTGVQHYIGTFWDILDDPGHDFALAFYHEMIAGATVGESVRRSRLQLVDKYGEETIVWASYMLYGDPTFNYLSDVAEAEEEDTASVSPVPPQAAGYAVAYPGQPVFRGAESAAMPRPAGMSKSAMAVIAALVVAVALIGWYLVRDRGVSLDIPEDAVAAGFMKLNKGDIDGAIKEFDRLAQNGPTKAQGLEGLAAAYLQKNDMVSAEQNAREALQQNPQAIYARIVLGQIAYNRGDYNAAVSEFNAATQGTGKDQHKQEAFAKLAMAYNAMGLAQSQSGDKNGAAKAYEDAYKADPKNKDAAINLGQTYLAMGKPAEAKEAFQAVAAGNPNDMVANTLLAQAVSMMASAQDAEKQAEVNRLAADLAARWKSGQIPAPAKNVDEWTSRPVTVTFLDFESKGRMTMEGEMDFLKIALAQALKNTGRVEVVEREKIDRIMAELNLASSELANEDTRLKLGRLFGARLIATGSFIRAGQEAQVNLRLIETETSLTPVAVSEVFKGKDAGSAGDLAKAVAEALVAKIKKEYPVQAKLTEVKGEEVKINVGEKAGVVKGMKLDILDNDLLKVGSIEITSVAPDVSAAKIIEKAAKIMVGQKVKEVTD